MACWCQVDEGRDESSSLQQQLDAALSELQHTRDLLGQLTQEGKAATAAACEQRFGALKVLLAQQITELWEAEAQRAAAVQLAADKVCLHAVCASSMAVQTHVSVLL